MQSFQYGKNVYILSLNIFDVKPVVSAKTFFLNFGGHQSTKTLNTRAGTSDRSDICKGFTSFGCSFAMVVNEKIYLEAYINSQSFSVKWSIKTMFMFNLNSLDRFFFEEARRRASRSYVRRLS